MLLPMNPRAKDMPVDIYVRVSRRGPREDERFHSPEEQERLARIFAESRGLRVGAVLPPDIDKSGGTVDREGLRRALERVRAGESQGIVVAWIDRFSRDAAQAYDLLREFEAAGGRVYAPEAPEDVSSPEGELQLGMFLLVAQYQRKRARAGFARAIERSIRAGVPVGPVPIGYRARPDRTLEVDPETAPIVRELFERRAAGIGWVPLGAFLRQATGRDWSRNTPAKIIGNRQYATGRLKHGDTESDVECGAIVDEALWHAAQRAYTGPRPKRDSESRWLLTGIARCASCGRSLGPWKGAKTRRNRRGERVPVKTRPTRYRCVHGCKVDVDAPRLERFVTLHAFAAGDDLETREQAPDLGALQEAVTTAERRLAQVLDPDARDALGELWAADVRARRSERDEALARLGEARQAAGVGAARSLRLRDVWDGLSPADRRDALALFWREVRVAPKDDEGRTVVTLVPRGSGAEAKLDLLTESNDNGKGAS